MAAAQLDKLWDGWMTSLSSSYAKTLDLMAAGKQTEAQSEFKAGFVLTVKKLYTETATTYPVRYAKAENWCDWVRQLYVLTLKTDKALAGKDPAEAGKALATLRQHFCDLHQQTNARSAGDAIFAFRTALAKDQPAIEELKTLRNSLENAKLSSKASADDYAKAKAEWAGQVDPILKADSVDAAKLQGVRKATESFYQAFGTQFE